MNPTTCPLCVFHHPQEIWRDSLVYVIDASNKDLPGYIRVILTRRVKEMTDLSDSERHHIMRVVFCIESAMRRVMHPEKVNLAEFGTLVPHTGTSSPGFATMRTFRNRLGAKKCDKRPNLF